MEKKQNQDGKSKTNQSKRSPTNQKPSHKDSSQLNTYLKYSGLGFQMLAVIGVSIWLGWKLDQLLALKYPVFLISLSMIGVFASLYFVIKNLPKNK